MLSKFQNIALPAGLMTLAVMALLPLLGVNAQWMRWVFAAGAALVLLARLSQLPGHEADNLRTRRLHRINLIAALLFAASAGLTIYRPGTTDWVAFLMAGAALTLYVSYALDHEQRRSDSHTDTDT